MPRWSEQDHERLSELVASGLTAKKIAGALGRTVVAVKAKMHGLGLHSLSHEAAAEQHIKEFRARWAALIPDMKRKLREEIEAMP